MTEVTTEKKPRVKKEPKKDSRMEELRSTNIYSKLLAFQRMGVKVDRDGSNPHYKSSYTSINEVLDKVKKPLNELGVVIIQTPQPDGLHTVLYDTESDTQIESVLEFVQKTDAQKLGSNITYNRRYSLLAMLGLEDEDDDGNAASNLTHAAASLPTIQRR